MKARNPSLSRLSAWAAGKALLQPHTYDMSLCLTHRVDFGGRLTVKTDGVHSAGREVWGYSRSLTDRLQVRAWSAKLQTCSSVVAKRSTVLRAALSAACSRYLAEGDYHASTREKSREEVGSRDDEGTRCRTLLGSLLSIQTRFRDKANEGRTRPRVRSPDLREISG